MLIEVHLELNEDPSDNDLGELQFIKMTDK